MLIMALCLSVNFVDAQNKVLEKALKKEYKTTKKRLEKENWKLFASSRSLDVVLLKHYDKLTSLGDNGKEVVGLASRFKSKNVGLQMAINSACTQYAQQAGSHVRGRATSDMRGDGVSAATEFDNFYAAYERLVEKEIRGEMEQSFAVIRANGDGTYEAEVYFVINEDAASKARMRALENAARESEAAQKWAQGVSDFVREGFENM